MEDKNFTPEIIEKARKTKSVEELLALAKENNVEMTEEQAKEYFERLHRSGELDDDELNDVAGGSCLSPKKCPICGSTLTSFRKFREVCPKCGR